MKTRINNLLLACFCLLYVNGNGLAHQESRLPCGDPADLLRDKHGKPVWYTSKQMKKRTESRKLPSAPILHMKGQFVVAVLVNAEGKVECAKSINRHPLAVKAIEERVSQLTFRPAEVKGKPVSVYGLLTLYIEYGSIRII